jgi:hypothetical protein
MNSTSGVPLPPITIGTPKQIAWAETIRAESIAAIEARLARIALLGLDPKVASLVEPDDADLILEAGRGRLREWQSARSAIWIINERYELLRSLSERIETAIYGSEPMRRLAVDASIKRHQMAAEAKRRSEAKRIEREEAEKELITFTRQVAAGNPSGVKINPVNNPQEIDFALELDNGNTVMGVWLNDDICLWGLADGRSIASWEQSWEDLGSRARTMIETEVIEARVAHQHQSLQSLGVPMRHRGKRER